MWVWGPGAQRQSKKARKRKERKTPNHATPGKHPTTNEESKRRKQDAEGTGEQEPTHEAKERAQRRRASRKQLGTAALLLSAGTWQSRQCEAEGPRLRAGRTARQQGVCTGTMADAFTLLEECVACTQQPCTPRRGEQPATATASAARDTTLMPLAWEMRLPMDWRQMPARLCCVPCGAAFVHGAAQHGELLRQHPPRLGLGYTALPRGVMQT